jgi:uncharacterized protein YdaU (DUF1376 family)
MNFYPHHIGDYLTATAHLTWVEDAAYRRLLDVYYSRELPIPLDFAAASRLVRAATKEERAAVETVLQEFFTKSDDGWTHSRCIAEIAKAKASADRSKANGMKGGRRSIEKPSTNPVGTQQVHSGLANGTQSEPDPKAPITNTNTNTSVTNVTGGKPPLTDPDEIIFGYGLALLTNAGTVEKQARSFLGGLRKHHGDTPLIDALRGCAKAKPLQPLEWLAAALPPGAAAVKPGKHAGFQNLNYREGIAADGTFV